MYRMDGWIAYVVVFAAIFGNNILPAFGPPTWTLLVFFKFNTEIPLPVLIVGSAAAAASGRFVLATLSRRFRGRFSDEKIARLETAREVLGGDRRWAIGGLVLFMLSPVPSAQLFVAAGLIGTPLVPLTVAFFFGRLVTYSLYLGGATLAQARLGDEITKSFTSPVGIALQLFLIAGIVALVEVDWTKWLPKPKHSADDAQPEGAQNDDGRPEGRPSGD